MREMMSYIFATLEHTENCLRNQSRFNRFTVIAAIGFGVYSAYQAKKIKAIERALDKKED